MISFRAKQFFFDRRAVIDGIDDSTRRALSKLGAWTMTRARGLIRRSKYSSSPGSPPHSHTGLLRRFIYFSLDATNKSVVVGPEKISAPDDTDAPHNLEYGGVMKRAVKNRRRRRRQLGGSGEIRLIPPNLTYRFMIRQKGARGTVRYAKLRTARQVDRANRLNQQLYGPPTMRVKIQARPFMGPAFADTLGELAPAWEG